MVELIPPGSIPCVGRRRLVVSSHGEMGGASVEIWLGPNRRLATLVLDFWNTRRLVDDLVRSNSAQADSQQSQELRS